MSKRITFGIDLNNLPRNLRLGNEFYPFLNEKEQEAWNTGWRGKLFYHDCRGNYCKQCEINKENERKMNIKTKKPQPLIYKGRGNFAHTVETKIKNN